MPVDDVSAVDMLPTFRAYTDAMVDESIAYAAAEGKPTSCRAGCAACCRQFVVISAPEARRIASLVEAMPEPRRSLVQSRFADADARIAAWSASLAQHQAETHKPLTDSELARSYVGLHLACPLLEDERCSIYEERPLVCREYLVTSPAELCSRLDDPGVDVEPIPRLFTSRALDHLLSDATPPVAERLALAQALRWVARNPVDPSPLLSADAWLQRFLTRIQEAGAGETEEAAATPPAEQVPPVPAADAEPPALKVDVPAEAVPARAMLPALRAVTEASVRHAVAQVEASGKHVSCKAGCGACCDQLAPVGAVEAHMIADLVEAMPEPRRSAVKARFAEAEKRLAAWPHRALLDNVDSVHGEAKYQLGLDYFRLGVTCPFLEDGSCSIYEHRPLVCREYLVTSPAAHCARQGDPTALIAMVPTANANHALALLPYDDSAALERIPLSLALSWAASHPEQRQMLPGHVWMDRFFARLRSLA
jgi:Fe-S-cluster containining protein